MDSLLSFSKLNAQGFCLVHDSEVVISRWFIARQAIFLIELLITPKVTVRAILALLAARVLPLDHSLVAHVLLLHEYGHVPEVTRLIVGQRCPQPFDLGVDLAEFLLGSFTLCLFLSD